MIQFKFNPKKIVQAAAIFLKLHGKPMDYLGLLKLLYMADRIALQRIEQPISGDRYYSMDFGPVLSKVYDIIKGQDLVEGSNQVWRQYITVRDPDYLKSKNYRVRLLKDPGNSELCEEEEDIVCEVYNDYGHLDRFFLADLTHQFFPEWEYPNGSAIPIAVEDILKNVGKNPEEIEEICEEVERENYLDKLLTPV